MNDQKKENINIVNNVFDEVTNSFIDDQDSIISNEAERAKLRYQQRERKFKIWAASRKCIFRNCEQNSISNSHTIQKKGSLQIISEAGHLLTPTFNPKLEGLALEKIGIKRASTFPGFCIHHERIFNSFENKSKFDSNRDIQLQIFRTISRELVIKQLYLECFEKMLKNYIDFRNKKLITQFGKKIGRSFLTENNIQFKSLSFQNIDIREDQLEKKIEDFRDDISEFDKDFYNAICNDLENGKENELSIISIHLDHQIPLSLAGRGNFNYKDNNGKILNIQSILLVLPFNDHTYVIGATPKRNKAYLDNYFKMFTQHPLTLLVMIEGWMLHGSDHWFLKPSVWDKITREMQSNIIKAIESVEKNVGHFCEFSIFNELRQIILNDLNEIDPDVLKPSFKEFIIKEKAKLTKSFKYAS